MYKCILYIQVYRGVVFDFLSVIEVIISVYVQVQWATGMGVDRHLSVTINAPSGLIVGSEDDARGELAFNAKETGE